MKLAQKPCELVEKNSEHRVIAQLSSFTAHNAPVIQGIVPPLLPTTTHQSVLYDAESVQMIDIIKTQINNCHNRHNQNNYTHSFALYHMLTSIPIHCPLSSAAEMAYSLSV